jgi:hypothetical protein
MRWSRSARAGVRKTPRRIPITIALERSNHAFIESCVSLKQFDSVDELFDAALTFYRRHVHALNTYAEAQSHKGYSRAELLECIECETLITKAVSARPMGNARDLK